jgi:5-methyltetrahydropteroyltriglutamate--homocysteine methyltransferase
MLVANNGSYPSTPSGATVDGDAAVLDRITREAIDAQIRAGCDLVTDGLVRRRDPVSHVAGQLEGVRLGEVRSGFPGSGGPYRVPIVHAEIAWRKPIVAEDFLFAKGDGSRPVKPVLVGPYTLSRVCVDEAYNDPMAAAMGFATALNAELKTLQTAGAVWIQIDEPAILQAKEDFPIFTRLWEVLGRGVSTGLSLHLEGGDLIGLYPGLARLKRLSCLSLDCVRGRASLDLLQEAPPPETLLLGLGVVDGRTERVESPDEILALLRSLPALPPGDRVVLGTASDLGGLSAETAFAKLRALSQARDRA